LSLIERAAALLGSTAQGPQDRAAASRRPLTRGEDLIERAAQEATRQDGYAGDRDRAPSLAGSLQRLAGRSGRVVAIDRARLQRQGLISPDGERTPVAEIFRRIKRPILARAARQRSDGQPANLVQVTSALAGEGKTYCAVNLAISIALEVDRTVLLVDADVAKSNVPRTLGFDAGKGLMDILLDRNAHLADVLWRTDIGNLSLLGAGTPHKHATELLASEAMSELLQEMAERYRDRIIVFDSPPLLDASEAGVLAGQMGQVVIVVEAGKTTDAALRDALTQVDHDRVVGLLLNKGQGASLEYGYGGYG
jgi:exopolysaccharide/PEP-CTERM locus tyrosine autokinase